MHTCTVSGPFIPKATQGSGVPRSLWQTGHCDQSCIGQAAQRGGMWVNVANDTLVLFPEGQFDWQLVLDRSQEGNCHLTLSLFNCLFLFFFLPPPFLSSYFFPAYFPSPSHFIASASASPPQPTFSLQLQRDSLIGCPSCPLGMTWWRYWPRADANLHPQPAPREPH